MTDLIEALVTTEPAATPEMFVGKPFLDETRTKTLGVIESAKKTERGIFAAIRLNEEGKLHLACNRSSPWPKTPPIIQEHTAGRTPRPVYSPDLVFAPESFGRDLWGE